MWKSGRSCLGILVAGRRLVEPEKCSRTQQYIMEKFVPIESHSSTRRRPSRIPITFTSMSAPAQARASHLLVKHRNSRRPSSWKEPVVTRSEEEALQLVKQYRNQIATASDVPVAFAELATTESHCGSARSGGDLGWFG